MKKAVILAAGRGTRMQGLTDDRPKPMLPVRGKPILEHLLDGLRAAGFTGALLVTGAGAGAREQAGREMSRARRGRRIANWQLQIENCKLAGREEGG